MDSAILSQHQLDILQFNLILSPSLRSQSMKAPSSQTANDIHGLVQILSKFFAYEDFPGVPLMFNNSLENSQTRQSFC